MYAHLYIHLYVCAYLCMYVCVYIYTYMHTYTSRNTHSRRMPKGSLAHSSLETISFWPKPGLPIDRLPRALEVPRAERASAMGYRSPPWGWAPQEEGPLGTCTKPLLGSVRRCFGFILPFILLGRPSIPNEPAAQPQSSPTAKITCIMRIGWG